MTWSDAALAGAFVVGATAGVVATIRITRYLLQYLADDRDERHRS